LLGTHAAFSVPTWAATVRIGRIIVLIATRDQYPELWPAAGSVSLAGRPLDSLGTWTISAGGGWSTGGDCGDEPQSLSATVTVVVEPW